jgi:hypothetical protein
MERSAKDILAGLTFVGFGLAFAIGALTYPVGSAARMGPGFFPLLAAGLLTVLGVLVMARSAVASETEPLTAPGWRGLALILAAILVFGLTVKGLGLVPSLLVTTVLAALASRRTKIPAAAVLAVALTIISVLVFIVALRLNVPLVGPWVPRP